MENDFLYMLCIVAAGFAVNFTLRALPFILFSTRKGALPAWVTRFGSFVSPVIIAALIVYSYSGLQWRTLWPYLAGAITVGLQLWRRNPLTSIVAGTAVYMCLVNCGCASAPRELSYDMDDPLIRVSRNGILFQDRFVTPQEVPRLLEKNRIPKDATIYVLVDDDYDDQRALWVFKNNYLSRNGYTRSAWVHKRRAESGSAETLAPKGRVETIPFQGKTIRRRP